MASQIPKVSIFIDKYHPGRGGLCAVSIRITFNKKRKYYPTTYSLSTSDFEKTQGSKPRRPHKEIAMDLQGIERKALQIMEDLPVFTFDAFEKYFLNNRSVNDTLNEVYQIYSEELRASDNIGTAISYECAARSLNKFASIASRFVASIPCANRDAMLVHRYKVILPVCNGCC